MCALLIMVPNTTKKGVISVSEAGEGHNKRLTTRK